MIAQTVGLKVGYLNHYINNLHIYDRHLELAKEAIKREPRKSAKLTIDISVECFYDFKPEHFILEGYEPHEQIKIEVAI